MGICFAHRAPWQERHVGPICIVDAHALEDVLLLRDIEDFVDGIS